MIAFAKGYFIINLITENEDPAEISSFISFMESYDIFKAIYMHKFLSKIKNNGCSSFFDILEIHLSFCVFFLAILT